MNMSLLFCMYIIYHKYMCIHILTFNEYVTFISNILSRETISFRLINYNSLHFSIRNLTISSYELRQNDTVFHLIRNALVLLNVKIRFIISHIFSNKSVNISIGHVVFKIRTFFFSFKRWKKIQFIVHEITIGITKYIVKINWIRIFLEDILLYCWFFS